MKTLFEKDLKVKIESKLRTSFTLGYVVTQDHRRRQASTVPAS